MTKIESSILDYASPRQPLDDSQTRAVIAWAGAAVMLGWAIQRNDGHFSPPAILALTVAIILATIGMLATFGWFKRQRFPFIAGSVRLNGLLIAAIAFQFVVHWNSRPGRNLSYLDSYTEPGNQFRFAIFLAAATILTGVCVKKVRAIALFVVFAIFLYLGFWLFQMSPKPPIDCYVFHQEESANFLRGENPYTTPYTDVYYTTELHRGGAMQYPSPYLPAGASVGGKIVFGFPYPPTSFYCSLVGYAATREYRYANLMAMILTATMIYFVRPGAISFLATGLLLFTPRSLFVLEQGWTEPYALMFLAGVVFCAVRAKWALPIALGLFLSVKQYFILAIPLTILLVDSPFSFAKWMKLIVPAFVTALILTLPFLIWDPAGYFKAVWIYPFYFPFRTDSLSYLAWIVHKGGPQLGAIFGLIAIAPVAGLILWKSPRSPSGFAAAVAMICLVFFAFNKQAFCNYYYFVIGAFSVAIGASNLSNSVEKDAKSQPAAIA